MRRRCVVWLLLVLPAAVLVATPTSGAAPGSSRPLTGRDLPTVGEVARLFPALRGGSRDVFRADGLSVRMKNCISYRELPADDVRWSDYATSSGDSPYFLGLQDPTFFLHRFADVAQARHAMAVLKRYVRRCAGRHAAFGSAATVQRVAVGDLGQERVGWEVLRQNGSDEDTTDRALDLYVRRGRTVMESEIQVDEGRPDRGKGRAMARLLLRTSR